MQGGNQEVALSQEMEGRGVSLQHLLVQFAQPNNEIT